jgi:hypothetical protein
VLEQNTLQKSLHECCKVCAVRTIEACCAVCLYIFINFTVKYILCVCVSIIILDDNNLFSINPLKMKIKLNYI